MTTFSLADLFEVTAGAVPDRTALVAGRVRHSYAQLDRRATRFANALGDLRVGAGDRVAIISGNRAEWMEAMLGCFKARAVPVNVNHRYTRAEATYVLRDCGAAVVVVEDAVAARLGDLSAEASRGLLSIGEPGDVGCSPCTFEQALAAASPEPAGTQRSGDDRYLLYTGGTTGRPKGVLWRHEDLFFAALGGGNPGGPPITEPGRIVDVVPDRPQPWLVTSPLMHGNGQWNSLVPLLTGRGVVLWTGRSFDGAAVARLAAAEHPRLLVLVGDAMALPFLEAVDDGDVDLTSVRIVASGGAMLSPVTKERLQVHLPGAAIVDGFGASETGSSGTMVGAGTGRLPRFRVGDDVAVLDDDLRPVAPGAVGRYARRGHVPLGYWNDAARTASTFPTDDAGVRWAIPGDLAQLEHDGTITLLGRGSTCINTGGEKVHPDEVASAIKALPEIADALVIGVPDERYGQAVVALVSEAGPTTEDDAILSPLRSVLAGYKLPRRIVRVPEIRYTPQGKPDLAWAVTEVGGAAP